MVFAGLGLILRHDLLPIVGFDLGMASVLTAIAGLLVFSGRPEAAESEGVENSTSYRPPMIIATLAILIVAGYTFSGSIINLLTGNNNRQIDGESRADTVAQNKKRPPGRAALRLRRQANGLFTARTRINGNTLKLTVDTGAATIVLSAEDARRAGIDIASLEYTVPVDTAHGTVYAAQTQLKRVFVGPLGAADVAALVASPGQLDFSILGMSFLVRLRSYVVEGNHLTLEG